MQVWFLRGNNCWERWQKLLNIIFFPRKCWTSSLQCEEAHGQASPRLSLQIAKENQAFTLSSGVYLGKWRHPRVMKTKGDLSHIPDVNISALILLWKSTRDHCPSLPQVRHLLAVSTTASTFHDGVSPNMHIIVHNRTQRSPTQVQTKTTKHFLKGSSDCIKTLIPLRQVWAQSSAREVCDDYSSSEGCQRGHARWRSSTRVAASTSTDAILVKCQIAHKELHIWITLNWFGWM